MRMQNALMPAAKKRRRSGHEKVKSSLSWPSSDFGDPPGRSSTKEFSSLGSAVLPRHRSMSSNVRCDECQSACSRTKAASAADASRLRMSIASARRRSLCAHAFQSFSMTMCCREKRDDKIGGKGVRFRRGSNFIAGKMLRFDGIPK